MRFWLDRGVDGFRLDVIDHLVKDAALRDNPRRLGRRPYEMQRHVHDRNQPETHRILRELRRLLDSYGDRMAVGEVTYADDEGIGAIASYYGQTADELNLAFNFAFTGCPWQARCFARAVGDWENALPPGGWPCYVLSNHDQPRHIDRYGRGTNAVPRAKLAAMMLLTLRGTPFLYYGEEIGLRNGKIPHHRLRDPVVGVTGRSIRGGMRSARRCSGIPDRGPASRPASPGCLSARIIRKPMWRLRRLIHPPCFLSIAV